MKAVFSLLTLFAAIPAALAIGYCTPGVEYCGTTLATMGWTVNELHDITAEGDAFNMTQLSCTLFYCEREDSLDVSETCNGQCIQSQRGGPDFCEIMIEK
ncbi:hypothetical protein BJX96DRAFT_148873 [Aspergillus floccosus]